jgi:hypothetical protein
LSKRLSVPNPTPKRKDWLPITDGLFNIPAKSFYIWTPPQDVPSQCDMRTT